MIEVKEITNKQEFENFNLNAKHTLFLQSWNFGEQNKALGEEVFRIGLYNDGSLQGIAQFFLVKAKRGSHFVCPYGPVLKTINQENLSAMVGHMKKMAKKQSVAFIRISPFIENSIANKTLFKQLNFMNAPMHILAEATWLIDLTKSEDQIFKEMRKTNRNLIRRAEREEVKVTADTSEESVETFIKLHKDTEKKHNFTPYPDDFFREQVRKFKADNQVVVYTAWHNSSAIGSAIVMFYGKMAAYHHGANSIKHRKIPGSYLIQWKAIQEAKKRGCEIYNFWGVSPFKDKKHPIAGVSHFKRGFGGEQFDLLHCQDLPLKLKYAVNWATEESRRRKRGYYYKDPE